MNIPFHKQGIMPNQGARERLFAIYIHLSMAVVLVFTILFAFMGFRQAALIQFIGIFPFMLALRLNFHQKILLSKLVAMLSSIFLVVMQTNVNFTRETGFHYQLIALVVVLYLINDMKFFSDRLFTLAFSVIIAISFFVCELSHFTVPLIPVSDQVNSLFHNLSLISTFGALSLLLYHYSIQLSLKEQALSYMADFDALIGIHNRGYFNTYGDKVYPAYLSKPERLHAIIMDVDDFKNINDTFGHPIGDMVLKQLAMRIKMTIDEDMLFSRYGGEEFALLIENRRKDLVLELAESIRHGLEAMQIETDQGIIKFTISLGVATNRPEHTCFDDIMRDADRALYASKHAGKNRITFYND